MKPGSPGWISSVEAAARVASCVGGFTKGGWRCTGSVDAAWEERMEEATLDGTFVGLCGVRRGHRLELAITAMGSSARCARQTCA